MSIMRQVCKVYRFSNSAHVDQIITGFLILEKKQRIELDYRTNDYDPEHFPHEHIVKCIYRDKIIIFDTEDGYLQKPKKFCYNDFLSKVDYYFKRSFSSEINKKIFSEQNIKKIYPLGFGYNVLYPVATSAKKNKFKLFIKKLLNRRLVYFFYPSAFMTNNHLIKKNNIKIIFFTRLWNYKNKEGINNGDKYFIDKINKTRIEIIRSLKKEYPESFKGGIETSDLAIKLCPDLIVDESVSNRRAYIKLMKKSDICIGTIGLHNSIGWKTGEYIAAGKAIVNEKFFYEVPGDFKEGINYLPFSDVNECLHAVRRLYDNHQLISKMKKANRLYYKNYLSPDKLIKNALDIVDKDLSKTR